MDKPLMIDDIDKQALIAAVEKFTVMHDMHQLDPSQKKYRELIPRNTPGPGQQYAFEVDLDKCTGCKACVTACHNENGLDEDETWRSVGLIQGGTSENPAIQHITTACHHCAEPACMTGCPTKAYVKDKETGIVKHLDDQCFGCQYCILKCPYDVPKYNKKKGIVHKCDMCLGRLKAGEPPACARACPTGAIRITLVNVSDVRKNPEEFVSVPDAPASNYTYPATRYITKREWPANMVSTDYLNLQPEHSHWPLVVMLVLTQLSVGTFGAQVMLKRFIPPELNFLLSTVHIDVALAIGLLALGASVLHLGRPLYAFRAILGLRTSWLSREILAFGLFASLAIFYALCARFPGMAEMVGHFWGGTRILENLSYVVFLSGLIGVLTSVMVYRDTKRPFWDNNLTTLKFILTTGILGLSMSSIISVIYIAFKVPAFTADVLKTMGALFCFTIVGLNLVKIFLEASIFYYLCKDDHNFLKKTAILMTRPLKNITSGRYGLGLGGVLFPLLILTIDGSSPHAAFQLALYTLFTFISLTSAEFFERYLFFRAVVPLKMPGGKFN